MVKMLFSMVRLVLEVGFPVRSWWIRALSALPQHGQPRIMAGSGGNLDQADSGILAGRSRSGAYGAV
jgi:hypothetical protein